MSDTLTDLLSGLEHKGRIDVDDVLALRRDVFGDAHISLDEADAIFRLNVKNIQKDPSWSDFFMEAISDFVVRQTLPYGYVDEANASWLMARISEDGFVETMTELRTLINILKIANCATERLGAFALEQVKGAVLHGSGVIGRSRALQPGIIGETEVGLLRAVLYASGGRDSTSISRSEANIIFDINDACRGQNNHESWTVLFRQAIANHLMVMASPQSQDRDAALRRDTFLNERGDQIASMASVRPSGIAAAFKSVFGGDVKAQTDAENSLNVQRGIEERITADEAAWLQLRIARDGALDENETALLEWLDAECPDLHSSLRPLIDAA